jgi:UDP-N-acetylglucosamine acyltransferase
MHRLRRAYRSLFFVEGRLPDRVEALAREFAGDVLVGKIVAFIRARSKRPLMRPRTRSNADATAIAESDEAK